MCTLLNYQANIITSSGKSSVLHYQANIVTLSGSKFIILSTDVIALSGSYNIRRRLLHYHL